MKRALSILVLCAALARGAFGWTADIWPATNMSPRYLVNTNTGQRAKEYWAMDVHSGIVERCVLGGIATSTVPAVSWWRFERANLVAAKAWVNTYCSNFLDKSKADGSGHYETWFASLSCTNPAQYVLPTWTTTALVAYVGAPTNFFSSTPWRRLNESTNGWDNLKKCIQALNWIARTGVWDEGGSSWCRYSEVPTQDVTCAYLYEQLMEDCEPDCDATAYPNSRPRFGFCYGYIDTSPGAVGMDIDSEEAVPWLQYTRITTNTAPYVDLYVGSSQDDYDCDDLISGGEQCDDSWLDDVCYTHYKESQTADDDEEWMSFSTVGDCTDLPEPDCCADVVDPGGWGGWAAMGPYFAIRYESGLKYQ